MLCEYVSDLINFYSFKTFRSLEVSVINFSGENYSKKLALVFKQRSTNIKRYIHRK